MNTALVIVGAQCNMHEGSQPVPSAGAVRTALGDLLDVPGTRGFELFFEPAEDAIAVGKD